MVGINTCNMWSCWGIVHHKYVWQTATDCRASQTISSFKPWCISHVGSMDTSCHKSTWTLWTERSQCSAQVGMKMISYTWLTRAFESARTKPPGRCWRSLRSWRSWLRFSCFWLLLCLSCSATCVCVPFESCPLTAINALWYVRWRGKSAGTKLSTCRNATASWSFCSSWYLFWLDSNAFYSPSLPMIFNWLTYFFGGETTS